MPFWWPFPVAAAFLLAIFLTPLVAQLAERLGFVDAPDGYRRLQPGSVPLLGGLALAVAFVVPTVVVLLSGDHLTQGEIDTRHFVGFFLGIAMLLVGGILDDKYRLPAHVSILFALFACLIAVHFGIGVEKVTNPLGGFFVVTPIISILITFIWLLGMTYTTKLLDGVDGLASGVTFVGALMIGLLALSEKFFQPDVAVLAFIFGAAILGFLAWNMPPATIYLGESGSTILGFTLGVLAVIAGSKLATILLVVGVPALDVVSVIARRLLARRSIVEGDRGHLHHLLLKQGLSPRAILALYMSIAFVFGLTTLVFSSWQKLVALGVLALFAGLLIIFLQRRHAST